MLSRTLDGFAACLVPPPGEPNENEFTRWFRRTCGITAPTGELESGMVGRRGDSIGISVEAYVPFRSFDKSFSNRFV